MPRDLDEDQQVPQDYMPQGPPQQPAQSPLQRAYADPALAAASHNLATQRAARVRQQFEDALSQQAEQAKWTGIGKMTGDTLAGLRGLVRGTPVSPAEAAYNRAQIDKMQTDIPATFENLAKLPVEQAKARQAFDVTQQGQLRSAQQQEGELQDIQTKERAQGVYTPEERAASEKEQAGLTSEQAKLSIGAAQHKQEVLTPDDPEALTGLRTGVLTPEQIAKGVRRSDIPEIAQMHESKARMDQAWMTFKESQENRIWQSTRQPNALQIGVAKQFESLKGVADILAEDPVHVPGIGKTKSRDGLLGTGGELLSERLGGMSDRDRMMVTALHSLALGENMGIGRGVNTPAVLSRLAEFGVFDINAIPDTLYAGLLRNMEVLKRNTMKYSAGLGDKAQAAGLPSIAEIDAIEQTIKNEYEVYRRAKGAKSAAGPQGGSAPGQEPLIIRWKKKPQPDAGTPDAGTPDGGQ